MISELLGRSRLADNAPRFVARERKGHVESYFIRANHPTQRRAIWLKATVLARSGGDEAAVAEVWCTYFDGDEGLVWAQKDTVPLGEAVFGGSPTEARVAGCGFLFGAEGSARGALQRQQSCCAWDLSWRAAEGRLGAPLCLLPHRVLIDGPFPKSKPLTPFPLLTVDGSITVDDKKIAVDGWIGMQGHNWGAEHAWEYAWGQCAFLDGSGEGFCLVEGFSSRIKLAGLTTPRMSAMVIRRGERSYRFDRVFDPWRQRAVLGDLSWTVRLKGRDGEAQLTMSARPEEVVCLGYHNPDGRLAFCLNSKLATAHLCVNPINEEGFECSSAHGGALEFLRRARDPRFDVI